MAADSVIREVVEKVEGVVGQRSKNLKKICEH